MNETKRIFDLLLTDVATDRAEEYLHWDELKRKRPLPKGMETHNDWWVVTKARRIQSYKFLPFKGVDEDLSFVYWSPDHHQKLLHEIAQQASGGVSFSGSSPVVNDSTRDRYLVNSLFEEAITSSQLEGASTTYHVAKQMLREGRSPRDRSERMIVNNYRAMQFVREIKNEELTKDLILELHRVVTDGTFDNPSDEGRFRTENDEVLVVDSTDNVLLHEPPPARTLDERIERICAFANGSDEDGFIHPVIRSVLLHLMVGYDHPFVDGNGRTARAIFYWSMVRQGYWLMEFIPISRVIMEAPSQYARAYLYVESDTLDATYFIDYNLRSIRHAIDQLHRYLARKAEEMADVDRLLGSSIAASKLNHRQIALLSNALRSPSAVYYIKTHASSHNVSYLTARKDLSRLVDYNLLTQRKAGNALLFQAVTDIESALKSLDRSE